MLRGALSAGVRAAARPGATRLARRAAVAAGGFAGAAYLQSAPCFAADKDEEEVPRDRMGLKDYAGAQHLPGGRTYAQPHPLMPLMAPFVGHTQQDKGSPEAEAVFEAADIPHSPAGAVLQLLKGKRDKDREEAAGAKDLSEAKDLYHGQPPILNPVGIPDPRESKMKHQHAVFLVPAVPLDDIPWCQSLMRPRPPHYPWGEPHVKVRDFTPALTEAEADEVAAALSDIPVTDVKSVSLEPRTGRSDEARASCRVNLVMGVDSASIPYLSESFVHTEKFPPPKHGANKHRRVMWDHKLVGKSQSQREAWVGMDQRSQMRCTLGYGILTAPVCTAREVDKLMTEMRNVPWELALVEMVEQLGVDGGWRKLSIRSKRGEREYDIRLPPPPKPWEWGGGSHRTFY